MQVRLRAMHETHAGPTQGHARMHASLTLAQANDSKHVEHIDKIIVCCLDHAWPGQSDLLTIAIEIRLHNKANNGWCWKYWFGKPMW